MTKVRRQKKRKSYNTNINRKRLRNRIANVGDIKCIPIKRAWNNQISARSNLKDMGLAYDPNEVLKIPSYKDIQKEKAMAVIYNDDFTVTEERRITPSLPTKMTVIKELEAEARAPKQSSLRLPKSHIDLIVYLMDKYGSDYKAMAKDRRNYFQETWKQLRAKIKKFMNMPKDYGKYLQSRGLLDNILDEDDIKKEVDAFDVNDSD